MSKQVRFQSKPIVVGIVFLYQCVFSQSATVQYESLFADVKAYHLGDVVTVLIMENANASRESQVASSSKSDVAANGSVSGNWTNYLPLFGASSSLSSSHDGSEGTKQKEQLTAKVTATIVEELGGDLFRIEGERRMEVNGGENITQVEGLIRSRDIRSDNTIYSYNIANAKIVYKKGGVSNKVAKPGTIHRWATWLLGVGLVTWAMLSASG